MSKYRVSHIPQVPMKSFNVEVDSVKEAVKVSEILKEYDKFQYDNRIKPDYCSATFIEEWSDYGDGYDWYSLEDEEVQELLEHEVQVIKNNILECLGCV